MARRQEQLFDEAQDPQTVQTADRLIELLGQKEELTSNINREQSQLISLLHKTGRSAIRHGGKLLKLQVIPGKERLVVKKAKAQKSPPPADLPPEHKATAPAANHGKEPPAPKTQRRRLVKQNLRMV